MTERRSTEKLFYSDEVARPTDLMVKISSVPHAVFISIFVTRKGHFEAKEDADFDYIKKIRIRNLIAKRQMEKQ